jgi:chromosome segregation ATPase
METSRVSYADHVRLRCKYREQAEHLKEAEASRDRLQADVTRQAGQIQELILANQQGYKVLEEVTSANTRGHAELSQAYADLEQVRGELAQVRGEVTQVRGELARVYTEANAEIGQVQMQAGAELARVYAEANAELSNLRKVRDALNKDLDDTREAARNMYTRWSKSAVALLEFYTCKDHTRMSRNDVIRGIHPDKAPEELKGYANIAFNMFQQLYQRNNNVQLEP